MAQTLPLRARLLDSQTGLTLTHQVLNLDRSQYAAAATGLTETVIAGEYVLPNGYSGPDAGGYVRIAIQAGATLGEDGFDPAPPTVAQIWAALTSGLTTSGSIGKLIVDNLNSTVSGIAAAVWTYVIRTLTSTAAQTTAALSGSTLTVTRASTFNATITGLTIPATWTEVYFTAKSDQNLTDAQSTIQIRVSNPGIGTDGLLYLNGAVGTAAQASLVVNQSGGTVAITITDDATALLVAGQVLMYDLKAKTSMGTTQVLAGESLIINSTPTRTV